MSDLPPLERIGSNQKPAPGPNRAHEAVPCILRRGFLNGSLHPRGNQVVDLTSVKLTNSLVFEDVQKALHRNLITPGLLEHVNESSELLDAMNDVEFTHFLELSGKDPLAAKKVLCNNLKLQKQFTAFATLMGKHFESLSNAPSPDPAIENALKNSRIARLVDSIRSGKKVNINAVWSQYPDLRPHLETLIKANLLSVSSMYNPYSRYTVKQARISLNLVHVFRSYRNDPKNLKKQKTASFNRTRFYLLRRVL